MLKVFEFSCQNIYCPVLGKVYERFLHTGQEDSQTCHECASDIYKIVSATKGYVKNTSNPCKC